MVYNPSSATGFYLWCTKLELFLLYYKNFDAWYNVYYYYFENKTVFNGQTRYSSVFLITRL